MNSNSGALIVPTPSASDTNVVQATLRDIKAPVPIPDYWLYFWIALGVLALLLLGFFAWKFWLKKAFAPKPVPPLPPHVRARRKLKEALAQMNDPKLFVSDCSDAIRVYLEESFDLRAPERTTEEFLHELQKSHRLAENVKASLGEFLSRCDLVKFAKYEPTQMELEDLHNAAIRIVEETEPKPNPQSAIANPESK
jgi:hypothetical protein